MTGRFYRGAYVEDDPQIVHTISLRKNLKHENYPINQVIELDGVKLKGVRDLVIQVSSHELTKVFLTMYAVVEIEGIPIVELDAQDQIGSD